MRTNGATNFSTLLPRQAVTATPYAVLAGGASNLLGAVASANLAGTYSQAVTLNNPGNSFAGNGGGLTNLNATNLTGTIPDARLSANVSLLGANIDSSEIVNGTIVNADIAAGAAIDDGKLATISTAGKVANSATTATSANTANTIVARDASGNFSAGTITGTFSGNGTGLTNLSLLSTAPAGTVIFTTNVSGTFGYTLDAAYPVPRNPDTVKSGDFNNDGRPDLIVISATNTSVLTNDGGGHFAQAGASIFSTSRTVALGDLNADGKTDFVITVPGFDTLAVYTNGGNASFSLAAQPAVGDYPEAVVVADFNGDGRLDLASANRGYLTPYTNTVTILTNNGAGGYAASATLVADSGPDKLLTAELNGDGKADLVVGHASTNSVHVFLGLGNGTFNLLSRLHTLTYPDLALGDVDGNGKLDLLASGNDSLVIFTNNGGGTLGSNSSLSLPAGNQTDIQASDINLDGKTDVLVMQASPDQILVLTNSGSGTFAQAAATVAGTSPVSVGAADLNIDGKQDLFCANLVDNTVMVFFSTLAATNVSATFQGTFNGSALNVNGNATISGFPIVTQTTASPTM